MIFSDLHLQIKVFRLQFHHLLQHGDGVGKPFFLFEKRRQVAVFCQGVADQSLFDVEFRQPMVDVDLFRIDLLHLLVNGNGLKIKTIVAIVSGDLAVLTKRFGIHPGTAVEFRQLLPISYIFWIQLDHLLIVLDCLRNLTFQQIFLCRSQEFFFTGQNLYPYSEVGRHML